SLSPRCVGIVGLQQLLSERVEYPLPNFVDGAHAVDTAVHWCPGRAGCGPVAEIVDDRPRRRVAPLQALANAFFAIVLALDQRLAGEVVATCALGRVEMDVVGSAARQ